MSGGLTVDIQLRRGSFDLVAAFQADARGVTALFGPSGAGKSLTLAAIAGAQKPGAGRIAVGERALFDSAGRVDVAMERRGIGWVFQDARLFPHLDVAANLRYGLRRAKDRARRIDFDEVVKVLDLAPLLSRPPRDLSGGERQRVGMGRALLSQPGLLLMDEPLSALDAARKAEILPFIERLKAFDLPILYVTHSLSEVLRLADRMVVIEEGRVVSEGALADVMTRGDIPLLAGRADAASAWDAEIAGHEPARGLTRLRAQGVELLVPPLDQPVGARVRAVVLARDVLLATEAPKGLSARNVLAGRIEGLSTRADGAVMVRVDLGPAAPRLLAAITRDAVATLDLAPGRRVWAVVKSVAVEGARGGLLAVLDD